MSVATNLTRNDIVSSLKSLEPKLRGLGVSHLAIYGSRARGDQRTDSDLDILVDVDSRFKFSLLDLIGVEHAISDTVGIAAHATMRRSLDPRMAKRIADDVIEVF